MEFPARATHDQRLDRARRITHLVRSAYGERVLAVGVYGSTARALDRSFSDLELAVVLPGLRRFARQEYFLDGWKTEVEYWPPERLVDEQKELDLEWPFRGGQFSDVLALHDPHGFWAGVAAFHPGEAEFRDALREALVGEYLEHLGKYLNAAESGDAGEQRLAYVTLTLDALGLAGLLNRRWYVSRATAAREALSFELLPAGHEALLASVVEGELGDPAALRARVLAYHAGVLDVAARLGVELWEPRLPDPPPLDFSH
ncbi:kanamycin nucleotidyltransferase C-terminal domain-containing protein [Deinococcus pimensis]|uniref:kanamycin nucleotidyltransferase C-terminal domain-containing protein n=1 Tax=Deinococcus pimensis TaxID=309888 RepID=UPI0004878384|nr:kanamycin nucleotidyltransferase C-terminal domain-containing protein [Deinococcus pimensis]